ERIRILILRKREHLVAQVGVVLRMSPGPGCRMHLLRVPTLTIHTVDAIELQPALLEVMGERSDHPPVLPLVEPPHRRRKDHHARAGVAEDEQLHLAAEGRAIPVTMFAMQGLACLGYRS